MNDTVQQSSSPIHNSKRKKNDTNSVVIIVINYKIFYDSPWLLNLISCIRRQANRKRIANEPIQCYQHKYHYHYYNVYSRQYWWWSNDSFSQLFRKLRQRYFYHYFFLRCSKASVRHLDTLMVYIQQQKLFLQVVPSQYDVMDVLYGSNIMIGNFSTIVGSPSSSLGSKHKRRETLKRELGAIVIFTSNNKNNGSRGGGGEGGDQIEYHTENNNIKYEISSKTTAAKTSPSCQYSSVENVDHIAKKQRTTSNDSNKCVSVSSSCHQEVANTSPSPPPPPPPFCNSGNLFAAEENQVPDDNEQVAVGTEIKNPSSKDGDGLIEGETLETSTTTKYQDYEEEDDDGNYHYQSQNQKEHQPKNQNEYQHQQYGTDNPHHSTLLTSVAIHSPRNDNDSNDRTEKKRTLLGREKDKFASPLKRTTSTRNQYGCDSTPHRGNTTKLDQIRETHNRGDDEGTASNDSYNGDSQTIEESEERRRIHVENDDELSKDSSSVGSVRKRLKMSQYDDDGNSHTGEGQSPSLMVLPSPKEPKHQKEKKKELTLLERFGLVSSTASSSNDGATTDIHTPPPRLQKQTVVGRVSTSNKKGNRYDEHSNMSQSSILGNNSAAFEVDSSPEDFPFCSYDHEEDSEADNSPKREAVVNASTKATKKEKKKRKRKRSKEERKRQKKEKKEEKRHKKQQKRIGNSKTVVGELYETKTSSVAIIDDDDKLETPRKLEIKEDSPVKEKQKTENVRMSKLIAKANTIIDEGNFSGEAAFINKVPQNKSKNVVANDKTVNDPFSLSQGTTTIEAMGRTSTTANDMSSNDAFSASGETIQATMDNDNSAILATDTTLDSSDNKQHNAPIRLLCSEFFLENYGEVIAELVRGSLDGEGTTKSIQFTDTNLIDMCGVDIETPGRGAIMVSSLSDIQKSGGLTNFLPRILELAATTRYHQLEIFICIDVELDATVTQDLGRLQTALLCAGKVTKTRTTFKLSTKRSLGAWIAKTIISSTSSSSSSSSSSGDMSEYSLSKVDHWLTDHRACRRLQFLLSVIPTLSVTGALLWLDTSTIVQEDDPQQQANIQTTDEDDDKSMRWIQKCFRNVDDESNRLYTFLQQSNQHDINPNVAMQLMMVATVGLNEQCWSKK